MLEQAGCWDVPGEVRALYCRSNAALFQEKKVRELLKSKGQKPLENVAVEGEKGPPGSHIASDVLSVLILRLPM